MRIISGMARGARLRCLPGLAARPTLDRVRESVFSSLGDLRGKVVVDLFAGSGALGLESLSRGAGRVFFVENNRRVLRVLRDNVRQVLSYFPDTEGEGVPSAEILALDARCAGRVLAARAGRVDIALADPPYGGGTGGIPAADLLADDDFADWLGEGLLVLEHDARFRPPWFPTGRWRLLKTRLFGNCAVSFATAHPAV